jgi:streptomycin 6-kinase
MTAIDIPPLVRQRALHHGAAGSAWLDALPAVIDDLADRCGLTLGDAFAGGTAGYVVAATDARGRDCVLKVAMPLDIDERETFARSVLAHQLAAGRGCAALLAHASDAPAMLLERLGPNLADLGFTVEQILAAIADTLPTFWRSVDDDIELRTGAEQAQWLARYIVTTWEALGRPCDRRVIDRAVELCDRRADAYSPERSVLVHGDAHGWNTLAADDGTFKFVDVEGLRSEPAHDLAVPMREYNEPLLGGDTARLVRARADRLAARCGVDPDAVWEWGFIERVSTGLANVRDFDSGDGAMFLEVARRCL